MKGIKKQTFPLRHSGSQREMQRFYDLLKAYKRTKNMHEKERIKFEMEMAARRYFMEKRGG